MIPPSHCFNLLPPYILSFLIILEKLNVCEYVLIFSRCCFHTSELDTLILYTFSYRVSLARHLGCVTLLKTNNLTHPKRSFFISYFLKGYLQLLNGPHIS